MAENAPDTIDFSGTPTVDVMQSDPPAGPYEVEILDVKQVTKEGEGGKTTLRFSVAPVEGDARGMPCQVVVGTDFSKPFNAGHLVNLLTGILQKIGKTPEEIKVKLRAVSLASIPAACKGKRAFIFVKSAPEGELDDRGYQKRADKNFISRDMYETAKKIGITGKAAVGAGASSSPPGAPPSSNGSAGKTTAAPPAPPPPPAAPAAGSDLGDLFT
jgi:hypothetical protein